MHFGNTQMHVNKYTIVHIDKYTTVQLTNAQLCTTLTNDKPPSNFSRPDISVVVMTSQGEDQILSKVLILPSAIPFDKWVRQSAVLSWNTVNRLPIRLECFRINLFKHGTDPHKWSHAKITSSKWQKKMLAGGMRRNICREWRKYFCTDAANPSEPAERKTSDSELGKESTNAGSQLLTVNLGKWAAHIFPRWESYAGMQQMWARVQPCAVIARAAWRNRSSVVVEG